MCFGLVGAGNPFQVSGTNKKKETIRSLQLNLVQKAQSRPQVLRELYLGGCQFRYLPLPLVRDLGLEFYVGVERHIT